MKQLLHILTLLVCFSTLAAQTPMKSFVNKNNPPPLPFEPAIDLPSLVSGARQSQVFSHQSMAGLSLSSDVVQRTRVTESGSFWIELKDNTIWESRTSVSNAVEQALSATMHARGEWRVVSSTTDTKADEHMRVEQTHFGIPIARQDMILHIRDGGLTDLNGYAWTASVPDEVPLHRSVPEAITTVKDYLISQGVTFQDGPDFSGVDLPEDEIRLCWYPKGGKLILAYHVHAHPNIMDHWTAYVDARDGGIIEAWSQVCKIYYDGRDHGLDNVEAGLIARLQSQSMVPSENIQRVKPINHKSLSIINSPMDGPTVISDTDLLGQSRTVNGYQVGGDFFMIDASRSGMFQSGQSVMPDEPIGVIWTLDGNNGSPQLSNFQISHVANTNNNWNPLEVSAHHNAGESYEYFVDKFNWNSLNGNGGNIVSIINVRDENGDDMDNAFWSGTAMFYGNGNVDFMPLARGLDVAGHEMSHGVVQNTANLEYLSQSGALNESYADIYGAMIDRDDWRIGEDVVNMSVFPSGALRDLSDPHNGGSGPQSNGWQPAHMNEYRNLPETPEGDNGGVHVNSGIPNKAFFLFASNVGKDKAEQVYFKALRDYLVKSSQFIDMRNAAEKAAADLHGASSAEVTAVRSAFDAVGIGAGQGGEYETDLEINPGADFVIATDEQESDLYWIPPSNPNQFVKLDVPGPQTRPSFTDDGAAAVYVDWNDDMIILNFDWSQGLSFEAFYLENNPQGLWRNVVVSKDGSKIAYTTSSLDNEIHVFDFISGFGETFELFNPTTAEGILTGDVLYPDAMEWDYSGEYIMYDALNRIGSIFGGIDYWDISFIDVWSNTANSFGSGYIGKLFNTLPENVSIGNPSFAKNSPYIIVFDFVEEYYDIFGFQQTDYRVLAANFQEGYVNEIYENTTVGYPSYSRRDDKVLFTYDDTGDLLLATININPAEKTLSVTGTDVVLINGAQKGVWFQTGTRVISDTEETRTTSAPLLYPQPFDDILYVKSVPGAREMFSYRLLDMTGRTIAQGEVQGNAILLNDVPAGPYVIEFGEAQGGETVGRQVVVKVKR